MLIMKNKIQRIFFHSWSSWTRCQAKTSFPNYRIKLLKLYCISKVDSLKIVCSQCKNQFEKLICSTLYFLFMHLQHNLMNTIANPILLPHYEWYLFSSSSYVFAKNMPVVLNLKYIRTYKRLLKIAKKDFFL